MINEFIDFISLFLILITTVLHFDMKSINQGNCHWVIYICIHINLKIFWLLKNAGVSGEINFIPNSYYILCSVWLLPFPFMFTAFVKNLRLLELYWTSQCFKLSNLTLTRRNHTVTEINNFSMVTLLVLVIVGTGIQSPSSHCRIFPTPLYCHVWNDSSQSAGSWSDLNRLVIILETPGESHGQRSLAGYSP